MESYHEFAFVYDLFMDNVPYKEWGTFLCHILGENQITDGLVLDLGCGTGKMTRFLRDAGYDMIGVDKSEEMLMEARQAEYRQDMDTFSADDVANQEDVPKSEILYLEQDMRAFELYGTVRAIVSVCDCMNYMTTEDDLLQVFRLANNYLDPKGLFIFDMKSVAFYRKLGDSTICENRPEGSFIWDNYYDEATGENQYDLTLYIREDLLDLWNEEYDDTGAVNIESDDMIESAKECKDDDYYDTEDENQLCNTYERFEETHIQKAFSIEIVQKLIENSGMKFIAAYDGYSDNPATEESERIVFVAQECGK